MFLIRAVWWRHRCFRQMATFCDQASAPYEHFRVKDDLSLSTKLKKSCVNSLVRLAKMTIRKVLHIPFIIVPTFLQLASVGITLARAMTSGLLTVW